MGISIEAYRIVIGMFVGGGSSKRKKRKKKRNKKAWGKFKKEDEKNTVKQIQGEAADIWYKVFEILGIVLLSYLFVNINALQVVNVIIRITSNNIDDDDGAAMFSLVVRLLLILSGIEPHPGPGSAGNIT